MTPTATPAAIAAANLVWATAFVDGLRAAGPRQVVVCPGSRSTPLVVALAAWEGEGARLHVVLDERSAGFFALALGRVSGRAAVVVCTSGSAGLHLAPAVAEAHHGGVPLVVLTADRPPELQDVGAAQTADQTHLFGRRVRFSAHLSAPWPGGDPAAWRLAAARACFVAEGGGGHPAGAAHLNVPAHEPLWRPAAAPTAAGSAASLAAAAGRLASVPRLHRAAAAGLAAADLAQAAARVLAAAGRGLVFCGPQPAAAAGDGGQVAALAARLGWPLLVEVASQWRAGDDPAAPQITCYGAMAPGLTGAGGPRPACVLRFGAGATATPVARMLAEMGRGCSIQVAADGAWRDPSLAGEALWAADPDVLCGQLLAALPAAAHAAGPTPGGGTRSAGAGWAAAWGRAEGRLRPAVAALCRRGFWGGAIAHHMAGALPAGALWHVGNSLCIRDVDAFAGALPRPLTLLHSRGLSGIDGAVAQVLGAAAAAPAGAPVAALLGDLTLLHDIGSLQLAAGAGGRPVVVVVVNNDGGGIFDQLPIHAHRDYARLFRAPHGRRLVDICRGFGVAARRVTRLADFAAALCVALTEARFQVIEAVVDADDTAAAAAALASLAEDCGAAGALAELSAGHGASTAPATPPAHPEQS